MRTSCDRSRGGNLRESVFGGAATGTQERTYDALNRLLTQSSDGVDTEYHYNLTSQILRQTLNNGTTTVQSVDAIGRMTERTVSDATPALVQSYTQNYDLAGNVRRIIEEYADATRSRTLVMTYDDADRLEQEEVTKTSDSSVVTTDYTYDPAYNRTSKTVTGGSGAGSWTYTFNTLNQLTAASDGTNTASYSYDWKGNRISRSGSILGGPATYGFDHENRLAAVDQGGGALSEYTYDYRTRRVERTEGGTTMEVIFAGGLSRAEQAAGGGSLVKFARGRDIGGGVDGLLGTVRVGETRFIHSNSRGDVTLETDSGGNELYAATYEAFGNRTLEAGGTPNRQKANTKEEDPTGLLNEGMRYRDIEAGVFITRDPAGFVDGPNLYAYVRQNPWTKFDPLGLYGLDDLKRDMGVLVSGDFWGSNVNSVFGIGGVGDRISQGFIQIADNAAFYAAEKSGYGEHFQGSSDLYRNIAANPQAYNEDQLRDDAAIGALKTTGSLLSGGGSDIIIGGIQAANGDWEGAQDSFLGAAGSGMAKKSASGQTGVLTRGKPAPNAIASGATKEPVAPVKTPLPTKCFAKGTIVQIPEGGKNIEEIKEGDIVCAFDFATGRVVKRRVLETVSNFTYFWAEVNIDGNVVCATRGHKFWVESEREWLEASKLRPGMSVMLSDGRVSLVHKVTVRNLAKPETTYNLIVEDVHNYFVGKNHVLVHNGYPENPQFPPPTKVGENFQFNFDASEHYAKSRAAGVRRAKAAGLIGPNDIGHHTNSVKTHPHLAAEPSNITPEATTQSHLKRHGGNFKNPTTGPLNAACP